MENSNLMTIKDYADFTGTTKQNIYKKIERGTLLKVVVDGVSYIEVAPDMENNHIKPQDNQIEQPLNNQLVDWLKEENQRLVDRIDILEKQLFDCSRESLDKVVSIQEKKDAQLQSYIEYLTNSTQQLIAQAVKKEEIVTPVSSSNSDEAHEAEIIEEELETIELNSYLKEKKYKKEYRKKAMEKAKKALYKDSERFLIKDKKIYIYPNNFKYSDLF